jgi:hypothetical protein
MPTSLARFFGSHETLWRLLRAGWSMSRMLWVRFSYRSEGVSVSAPTVQNILNRKRLGSRILGPPGGRHQAKGGWLGRRSEGRAASDRRR